MFKKIIKGEFNYLKRKKTRVIIITILYFAIALGIITIGYITTQTKRNLLTVVGILGCLPACKSLVNMIMLLLVKGCSCENYEKINNIKYKFDIIYDMYFTSYNKNYLLSSLVVNNNRIIGFTEDNKMNIDDCINHLNTMLKNSGHKSVVISITNDIDKYIGMLNNLNEEFNDENINKDDDILLTLYEISI